jgi:hypothetical protein
MIGAPLSKIYSIIGSSHPESPDSASKVSPSLSTHKSDPAARIGIKPSESLHGDQVGLSES